MRHWVHLRLSRQGPADSIAALAHANSAGGGGDSKGCEAALGGSLVDSSAAERGESLFVLGQWEKDVGNKLDWTSSGGLSSWEQG